MAREKRPPHRSPNSFADANRDVTLAQMELVRKKNTLERRQALVNSSVPEETPVPVGFASQTVDEAQKPKRQRDLEKAQRIILRRLNGQPVTRDELDWANALCAREAKMEQAELEQAMADDMKKQQHQEDQAQKIQEIIAAKKDPTWTERMLNRVFLDEGDKSDSESDSDLAAWLLMSQPSTLIVVRKRRVWSVTRLPFVSLATIVTATPRSMRIILFLKKRQVASTLTQIHNINMKQTQVSLPSPLSHAIATLTYDENPADRPDWLTGLSKRLPHPSLTALQDHEVTTRFWDNEIARLKNLRASLHVPSDQPSNGEWMYRHFGSTMEVMKKKGKGKKESTLARELWTYVVEGEEVKVRLDEWPVGLDGEPVGSGTHELEDWGTERALRGEGVPEEEREEEEVVDGGVGKGKSQVGFGRLDGVAERNGGELGDGGETGFEAEGTSDANNGMAAKDDVVDFEVLGNDIWDSDVWEEIISIDDEE